MPCVGSSSPPRSVTSASSAKSESSSLLPTLLETSSGSTLGLRNSLLNCCRKAARRTSFSHARSFSQDTSQLITMIEPYPDSKLRRPTRRHLFKFLLGRLQKRLRRFGGVHSFVLGICQSAKHWVSRRQKRPVAFRLSRQKLHVRTSRADLRPACELPVDAALCCPLPRQVPLPTKCRTGRQSGRRAVGAALASRWLPLGFGSRQTPEDPKAK
eukprot:scaffold7041_cov311-Pinguiococcus_pyrenoidosus.AAC.6